MKLSYEEKRKKVQDFRPIDDTFFEVFANNCDVCQEILRVILEDEELEVIKVDVQENFKNLIGRSIRLDALCILKDGTRCNIEVQRADNDDHLRRARYHASCITASLTDPGDDFRDIPTVYVIYISEFDFLKKNRTIYHIDKVIRETGTVIDDGLHEIFVNTNIDDGSDIAELMSCFMQKEVDNPKFPCFSSRVQYLKNDEGGIGVMCEVMEKYAIEYAKEYAEKYAKEYAEEYAAAEKDRDILNALKKGITIEVICAVMGVTESRVKEIQKSMEE